MDEPLIEFAARRPAVARASKYFRAYVLIGLRLRNEPGSKDGSDNHSLDKQRVANGIEPVISHNSTPAACRKTVSKPSIRSAQKISHAGREALRKLQRYRSVKIGASLKNGGGSDGHSASPPTPLGVASDELGRYGGHVGAQPKRLKFTAPNIDLTPPARVWRDVGSRRSRIRKCVGRPRRRLQRADDR